MHNVQICFYFDANTGLFHCFISFLTQGLFREKYNKLYIYISFMYIFMYMCYVPLSGTGISLQLQVQKNGIYLKAELN